MSSHHAQPYRTHDILDELYVLWERYPDLRESYKPLWLRIIEWCRLEPICLDKRYFGEERREWEKYYGLPDIPEDMLVNWRCSPILEPSLFETWMNMLLNEPPQNRDQQIALYGYFSGAIVEGRLTHWQFKTLQKEIGLKDEDIRGLPV